MPSEFKFFFNRKRQWVSVYLYDVHPTTFSNWGAGRWAYFQATWEKCNSGEFGELHFVKSRLRMDTIIHELFHVFCEWLWQNGETMTRKNEEKLANFLDELTRSFLRELRKTGTKL